MEDLIYILLGLVWLVFVFYRQSQKKKAAKPPAADLGKTAKGPLSFFEEMLIGDDEKTVVPPHPADEIDMVYADAPVSSRNAFHESSFEDEYEDLGIISVEGHEGTTQVTRSTGDEFSQDDFDGYEIENDEAKEGFNIDLRQAVIYSEILNRPDF